MNWESIHDLGLIEIRHLLPHQMDRRQESIALGKFEVTYFAWAIDRGVVKIGRSTQPWWRCRELAKFTGSRLFLLGVSSVREICFHSEFSEFSAGWRGYNYPDWMVKPSECGATEWFWFAPPIVEAINRLAVPCFRSLYLP